MRERKIKRIVFKTYAHKQAYPGFKFNFKDFDYRISKQSTAFVRRINLILAIVGGIITVALAYSLQTT